MNADVRHWFQRATELPPEGRVALLDRDCFDAEVRDEVLSLLSFDTETLPPPPPGVRQALTSAAGVADAPARRVGNFELGALLGCGGMGLVYEGHRADGTVRQRVAVKFAQISPSATSETRERVHRRFVRERQLLASLRHPYIAGLIDAGTTIEGTPYAVLEQVQGLPIDQFCDRASLSDTDRIRLVLKLCDAVQFAHHNLVVHSDIKPDNILVTEDGIPKLIDFGVADDLSDDAAVTSTRAFTPGYASPEQSAGSRPTVATDIYGLGAVLYRLLTGAKLRDTHTESLADILREIRERDVVRPSQIRGELKGDIENILLKALHRDPRRRYGSVPEFADDLTSYLEGRPVRATPDSSSYRFRRFAARNKTGLGIAGVIALAAIAGAALAIREWQQEVQRAADIRRLAGRLLFEVHDDLEDVPGATKAREKLSAIAAQYLDSLQRNGSADPEFAWDLINAYARLSRSRGNADSSVGDTAGGVTFARKVLTLGSVVERGNPDQRRLDALFRLYDGTISVLLEAELTAEARQIAERMLAIAPALSKERESQAHKQSARTFDAMDRKEEATAEWARSAALLMELRQRPDRPENFEKQLANTLVGLGRAQAIAGDFSKAVSSLQQAIHLSHQRLAQVPTDTQSAKHLYWSYIALGDVFGSPARFSLGRPAEASRAYREAQAIAQRAVLSDAGNDMARVDLARAVSREGAALAGHDPERAYGLLRRASALADKTSTANYAALECRYTYQALTAEAMVGIGRVNGARQHLEQARDLLARLRAAGVPANERTLLRAETIFAAGTGNLAEALRLAQRHLATLPAKTAPVLSQNWATVEVLGRIRSYAEGFDAQAYAAATNRLAQLWLDLERQYPASAYVRNEAARFRSSERRHRL